jgi:hypothetical protein
MLDTTSGKVVLVTLRSKLAGIPSVDTMGTVFTLVALTSYLFRSSSVCLLVRGAYLIVYFFLDELHTMYARMPLKAQPSILVHTSCDVVQHDFWHPIRAYQIN